MKWTKYADGSYRPSSPEQYAKAYIVVRDRITRLYMPYANGQNIKPSGKRGYFVLAEAKKCCERHAAQEKAAA